MPSAVSLKVQNGSESSSSPAGELESAEYPHLETASRILDIVSQYQLSNEFPVTAKGKDGVDFLAHVHARVAANKRILMSLPAFPFKSPNDTAKVLGRLPDKAEEFALAHLDGLCAAIENIYAPGATLMIVSDGLVYNDLLGVPDRDVWAYGEALRALRTRKNFRHIEFCRLKDIVHVDVPDKLDEIRYVANATNFRVALLQQYKDPKYNVSLSISENEDTCLTYRGYIKFLETDLQHVYPVGEGRSKSSYKRGIEYIAKQMLTRGDVFARAVRERFPDRLRLSIHPSTGKNKISVSLLPTTTSFTTPWHCSIGFSLDGTVVTGHRSRFEDDPAFELVKEDGRPSYFREKSKLLSWAGERGGVTCEPVYPTGLLIRPAAGRNALSVKDIDAVKIRGLSQLNSPIVLRDFAETQKRDLFVSKVREFGGPLPWKIDMFSLEDGRTNDFRCTTVLSDDPGTHSVHDSCCDGGTASESESDILARTPTRFQLSAAATKSPKNLGPTLFSSPTLLLKRSPNCRSLSPFRPLKNATPASSRSSTDIEACPSIMDYPATPSSFLHPEGPWPQPGVKFGAADTTSDDTTDDETASSASTCSDPLPDRQVTYYHEWERGDLILSDAILTSITWNRPSTGCKGELWNAYFG
ncbi:Pyoverdine/dityrosine biosynthesis protein-domain-containing protein [Hypoxylon sp. FL1284]|nr:Pyoverdine/dityrosine biosynthesis protein-domain-containing protein [Hypoxylon sp. FL1284]